MVCVYVSTPVGLCACIHACVYVVCVVCACVYMCVCVCVCVHLCITFKDFHCVLITIVVFHVLSFSQFMHVKVRSQLVYVYRKEGHYHQTQLSQNWNLTLLVLRKAPSVSQVSVAIIVKLAQPVCVCVCVCVCLSKPVIDVAHDEWVSLFCSTCGLFFCLYNNGHYCDVSLCLFVCLFCFLATLYTLRYKLNGHILDSTFLIINMFIKHNF